MYKTLFPYARERIQGFLERHAADAAVQADLDLLEQEHLRAHFDTTTGPKREAASYERIARELGVKPGAMLFLSDVAAELDAARAAGLRTALCVRPGSSETSGASHAWIRSFDEVLA